MIKNQFGVTPEELFQVFEPNAFAAASIGQVHTATTKDGKKVGGNGGRGKKMGKREGERAERVKLI